MSIFTHTLKLAKAIRSFNSKSTLEELNVGEEISIEELLLIQRIEEKYLGSEKRDEYAEVGFPANNLTAMIVQNQIIAAS